MRLIGYSVAGEETVIAAPELNVCFDIGKAPSDVLSVDHVLLTHGHMDHSAGIAYYLSQRNFVGNAAGTVLMPEALVQPIRELMRIWGQIEGHISPGKVIGMKPGDRHEIRRGLIAHAFEINHGVPALGYGIVDVRHKLKPEFADRTGLELAALKRQGVAIEYNVEIPLLAYGGDTAEGNWLDLDIVRNAKVLIMECTFFDPDHVRRAREGYHMHVRDVARILTKLKNEHIVLSHVTRRTSIRDAARTLAKMIDEETLSRVTFLMEGRRPRPVNPDTGKEGNLS